MKHHVHSTPAVIGEFVEDLFHADHRVWRTLMPLLFKPGFLTNEYLRGKRVSYTPPFRLYIVLSLIFFLTVSLSHTDVTASPSSGGMPDSCSSAALERALPESPRSRERLLDVCRNVTDDSGKEFTRSLREHIPQMMFFFLPLIALFAKVLFLGSRRHYAEHLLFFVHFHAFAFLILAINNVAGWMLGWFGSGWSGLLAGLLTTAVVIYSPAYLYFAMRRVYGQGKFITATKFLLLLGGYAGNLLVAFAIIAAFTAMTLPSH